MLSKLYIAVLFSLGLFNIASLNGQISIYTDSQSLVTGTWDNRGTVTSINTNNPCEGINHYRFQYNGYGYWAGFGLNLNNWASNPGISYDFTPYNNLRFIYRGISSGENLTVKLRNRYDVNNEFSLELTAGTATNTCDTVYIPLNQFVVGTQFNLASVTDIDFSVTGVEFPSGTVYVDYIQVLNFDTPEPDWSPAMEVAWKRHSYMDKGFNCSNWLEAYWLIPFNAYPEVNKYNRTLVSNLKNQGFNSIRLPVTFERMASTTPPYTIPSNHVTWDLIDSSIVWAENLGLTVALCNHHGLPLTNQNYQNEIPRIKSVWGQIADRYKGIDPEILMFELYNEPHDINNDNFRIVAQNIIDTIRSQAPHHTLIVGGDGWNSAIGLVNSFPYLDSNIIYTFHSYEPYFFTHQGMSWTSPPYLAQQAFPLPNYNGVIRQNIESVADWADLYSVPVMLGEFGVSTSADAASRCNYIDSIKTVLNEFTMPWYYWDAISNTDAFGFVSNGGTQVLPCFAEKLKLGSYDVCPLEVTTDTDMGIGSLREQILCAQEGDTILIHSVLVGDTIMLKNKPIFLHKSITINNDNQDKVYLSSSSLTHLTFVGEGHQVKFLNFGILPTHDLFFNGEGTLEIEDCALYPAVSYPLKIENGVFIINGENSIKN